MFIIVNMASAISIRSHIIFAFIIPPMKMDVIVTIFNIFMGIFFLVRNFRQFSP